MRRSLLLPLVPLLVAAACGGDDSSSTADDETTDSGVADAAVASDITRAPVDPTALAPVVVRGTNNVAFQMLGALYDGADVVISPTSVSTAFAMAAAGADEATRAELDAVFGYPPGEQLPAAMNTLTAQLVPDRVSVEGDGDAPVFELANATWVQDGVQVGGAFLQTIGAYYGAGVETVDFADQEATRSRINEWIAERTHDRIPELLAAPGLDPDTRFALANAAYFKASWAVPFDEASTSPMTFTTATGAAVQAPTMHAESTLSFVLDEDVVAVHLPYLGNEYQMTIAMPDDIAAFLATADHDAWSQLAAAASTGSVVLDLPRWEATTTADLMPALSALGLTVPGGSYPGIIDGATVGAVAHGANITVDERGTEAAAATLIAMPTSMPVDPIEIRIDRPYVYAITHVPTGLILFAGIETDPTT